MILHPAIVALLLSSCLVTFVVLYAAFFGARIIRNWDITSGSEGQLALERMTYLISTLLACAFVFQIASLFLYIYTADDIHSRFVGAMCAAGSLNVNPYGYPAFVLKIFNCVLAGLWLIMNYADGRAYDYPLIRKKLMLLLVIAPFVASETVVQAAYFLKLRPDVVTSCCGSLFSSGQGSVSGDLAGLPPGPDDGRLLRQSRFGFGNGPSILVQRARRLALLGLCHCRVSNPRSFLTLFHIPLFLRASDPSLPVLYPPERVTDILAMYCTAASSVGWSAVRGWGCWNHSDS